ncbi:hypothetical protein BG005_002355 [Podila minutissima]|nr:hypothetical protein BG005_002355 [Podila minutissima]
MNQPKEIPPPYSPPTPAHYGSTSNSIPEASLFSIFVIQDGHSTSQAFSVKAHATDTVDDLKKLIRTAKSPRFDNISADELKLASVCIPDDVHTEHKPRRLRDITFKRALRSTEILVDVFENHAPARGRIHVVICDANEDPDKHGKYGGTGSTPIKTIQYTISILHSGQPISQAFSTKAFSTETVDDLKKLTKIDRSTFFQ